MKLRMPPTLKPLLLALLVSQFFLSTANAVYYAYGSGTKSCGVWTKDHASGFNSMMAYEEMWVLGYISAAGNYGPDLKHTDGQAMVAWMTNYCKENPLKEIKEAADQLVKELIQ